MKTPAQIFKQKKADLSEDSLNDQEIWRYFYNLYNKVLAPLDPAVKYYDPCIFLKSSPVVQAQSGTFLLNIHFIEIFTR